jgi:hypothetical protein
MILVEGSGRAADAIVSLLKGTQPADEEVRSLLARARSAQLTRRPDLYRVVPLSAGASGLADAIRQAIAR